MQMEATNTLIRFGERVNALRLESDSKEGKALLDWVNNGGLESLEPGLVTFLNAAVHQPEGSIFYETPDSVRPPREYIDMVANTLRDRAENIPTILNEMKEHKEFKYEPNLPIFAAFLAGWGVNSEDNITLAAASPADIQEFFDWYNRLVLPGNDNTIVFLKGYDDKELLNLAGAVNGIYNLLTKADNPFSKARINNFYAATFSWYLAGRGYTSETLAALQPVDALDLFGAYDDVQHRDNLNAFLEGYRYEPPEEQEDEYEYNWDDDYYDRHRRGFDEDD